MVASLQTVGASLAVYPHVHARVTDVFFACEGTQAKPTRPEHRWITGPARELENIRYQPNRRKEQPMKLTTSYTKKVPGRG